MSNALGAGAPGGGDQGGFMQWLAGLPAAAQAQIMRTMNYANPVQPAAADTLNPSPVDSRLAGGGPPMPDSLASANRVNYPIGGGPGNALQAPTGYFGDKPVGGGGDTGGGGASGTAPIGSEDKAPVPINIPLGGGAGMAMEAPSSPPWFPSGGNTPTMAIPSSAAPASAGGNKPAVKVKAKVATPGMSGSPFTMINRPNMSAGPMYDNRTGRMIAPSGGALAGGRGPSGGAPLMTALDLSRLFGRS